MNAVTWNTDTTYALGLHRIVTRILGIWPPDRHKRISTVKIAISSILQFSMIIIFTKNLITKGNCSILLSDIVDILTAIVTSIRSCMKIILLYIHRENMNLIVNSAVKDWTYVADEKSHGIMLKYASIGRIVLIVQMGGCGVSIFPLILTNLPTYTSAPYELNENFNLSSFRNIPIGPKCWISQDMSNYSYFAYYSLVTSHLVVVSITYCGADVYIFGIAMHVCGQFEVLFANIENINGEENFRVLREKIKNLCNRHNHLLNLTDKFEKSFNLLILVQVAANAFVIGITGIVVLWSLKSKHIQVAISLSIRVYILYAELYLYCYIGQHLAEQAGNLQLAVYNCSWYKMPPSLIRDLKFIMMRNIYPFHLTAGKIYNMNISNFQNLVRTMFSYFSVIRLMFEK